MDCWRRNEGETQPKGPQTIPADLLKNSGNESAAKKKIQAKG